MKDGVPIMLGYLAVSFTFGIEALKAGLTIGQAVLMSAMNLTSAGQFASLSVIAAAGSYVELALSQLIINLRYCLMSCSLSQKIDPQAPFYHRFFVAYGNTDEVFALSAAAKGYVSPVYSYGVILVAVFGWTMGTFLGAVAGSILPARVLSALGVALYGMFIAIVVPPATESRVLRRLILAAMLVSTLFTYAPLLRDISSGVRVMILTVGLAALAAWLAPVKEEAQ
ncbi:MAG: AzlC family ABC transporter permease [Clostridia bacterium]|nr:AzlC family ABC transporter permease [Clostridia bacterium]